MTCKILIFFCYHLKSKNEKLSNGVPPYTPINKPMQFEHIYLKLLMHIFEEYQIFLCFVIFGIFYSFLKEN